MKSLVVYYSLSGKTEIAAETIAETKKGRLRKILEIHKRGGILSLIDGTVRALLGIPSHLRPMDFDTNKYDTVFLGGPTWACCPAPALAAFISEANIKGKNILLFLTHSTPLVPKAKRLKNLIAKNGGKVLDVITINTDKLGSKKISEAVKKIISGLSF